MIHIAIAFNHSYTGYAYTLLTSLFLHHTKEELTVFILHQDLQEEDIQLLEELAANWKQQLIFMHVSLAHYEQILPTTESWSIEMYYRLLLGDILPNQVERVLYLDVDMIVNGNLSDLYFMDLQGMDLAAADDAMIQGNFSEWQNHLFGQNEIRYFNSGLLLLDLAKLRTTHSFLGYMEIAKNAQYELTNPDQDILNFAHAGRVFYLDNTKYNVFSQSAAMANISYEQVKKEAVVIHFAGRKPWNCNGIHYAIERIWWDYAKETPFYYLFMENVFLQDLEAEQASYEQKMALLQENAELKKNLSEAMELCQKLFAMLPN